MDVIGSIEAGGLKDEVPGFRDAPEHAVYAHQYVPAASLVEPIAFTEIDMASMLVVQITAYE